VRIELLTQLGQGGIGVVLDHTAHAETRRLITARTSATRVGLGRERPAGAATPYQLLDKRLADAKQRGAGALGAEPLATRTADLVSQVKGIGVHASQHRASMPYRQLQTALKQPAATTAINKFRYFLK
jgi:hypothetical protein